MKKIKALFNFKLYKWLFSGIHLYFLKIVVMTLLSIIVSTLFIAIAATSKQMVDQTIGGNVREALKYTALFAFLVVMQILSHAYLSTLKNSLKEQIANHLQGNFIRHYFNLNWISENKFHSGDIITRFTEDINNIVDAWIYLFPSIISLIMELIIAFLVLYSYDKTLALFAFFLSPISVLFSWLSGRKLKKMQTDILNSQSNYNSYLNETIQNMLIIKTFEYENESLNNIKSHQSNLLNLIMKSSKFSTIQSIFLGIGYRLGFFLAFLWGTFRISANEISYGTFIAFLQLIGHVQAPIENLTRSLPKIILTVTSAERLMQLEALDCEQVKRIPQVVDFTPVGINIEDVSFYYNSDCTILDEISIQIKPGEITAIIGTSGEGKTTILRLLLSLIYPQKGNVNLNFDNGDKLPVSPDTRAYFTYVPQGNTLFSGSISDNLRIGNYAVTEDEMMEALKTACIWEFVRALPDGLNAVIGENGVGLSEGQAQRICIARALLRKSPILLLDEVTSALDLETEANILKNIKELTPLRTCITITHRASVFNLCDNIYELSKGHILLANN